MYLPNPSTHSSDKIAVGRWVLDLDIRMQNLHQKEAYGLHFASSCGTDDTFVKPMGRIDVIESQNGFTIVEGGAYTLKKPGIVQRVIMRIIEQVFLVDVLSGFLSPLVAFARWPPVYEEHPMWAHMAKHVRNEFLIERSEGNQRHRLALHTD